jgi:hypothetical protein
VDARSRSGRLAPYAGVRDALAADRIAVVGD